MYRNPRSEYRSRNGCSAKRVPSRASAKPIFILVNSVMVMAAIRTRETWEESSVAISWLFVGTSGKLENSGRPAISVRRVEPIRAGGLFRLDARDRTGGRLTG